MMNRSTAPLLILALSLWVNQASIAQDEPHRATRLGNPATRFAAPLKTPEDLRSTLLKESLQADVMTVLRMSDYIGDIDDFRHAVANTTITPLSIPPGTLLPAMSTRLKGKPVVLRNVLWAGKKPIDAYTFSFISGDRRYRVVTPKACSNFWVEEQLPRPTPILALSCETPTESAIPRVITHCNTLSNTGEMTEPLAMLSMQIPASTHLESTTGQATTSESGEVTWKFEHFAPGTSQTRCATFAPAQLGSLTFKSAAVGNRAASSTTQCETRVFGVPAVLLEVIDLADPVMVGNDVVYVIRVLNQGTQPLTNVKIVASTEDSQRFLNGSGATQVNADGALIAPTVVPLLNPKEQIEWRIVVKAEKAGDVRFNVGLHADQFTRAIMETEATYQY